MCHLHISPRSQTFSLSFLLRLLSLLRYLLLDKTRVRLPKCTDKTYHKIIAGIFNSFVAESIEEFWKFFIRFNHFHFILVALLENRKHECGRKERSLVLVPGIGKRVRFVKLLRRYPQRYENGEPGEILLRKFGVPRQSFMHDCCHRCRCRCCCSSLVQRIIQTLGIVGGASFQVLRVHDFPSRQTCRRTGKIKSKRKRESFLVTRRKPVVLSCSRVVRALHPPKLIKANQVWSTRAKLPNKETSGLKFKLEFSFLISTCTSFLKILQKPRSAKFI